MLDILCYTWPDWTFDSKTNWLYPPNIQIVINTWLDTWLDTYYSVYYPHYYLFTLFMPFLIPLYTYIYIFFICSHVISTCIFQFILIHSLGVLTPLICISKSVAIYCWSGIWRGLHASWGAGVSLFLIIDILFLLFILFLDSLCTMSSCHFFSLFIWYHCFR